jgi:Endonuclease-reverse transcriptase
LQCLLDDFDDILERTSTFACPVILIGDLNLHLHVVNDSNTARFHTAIESHRLQQHVSSPTHRSGHLLDVFITRSDCPVRAVDIQPPGLSDHTFITVTVDLQFQHSRATPSIRRRQWRAFDFDKFCHDLSSSALLCDPPSDAVGLFTCYHNTLQALVGKHAPFAVVRHRVHLTAPWYDHKCPMVKTETRKFERIYRRDNSDDNRVAWRHQLGFLRFTLRQRYVDYWSEATNSNVGDSNVLWSKINMLLKAPKTPMTTTLTADDFAVHFRSKVDLIRMSTSGAPPPEIISRPCDRLSVLRPVTAAAITKIELRHQRCTAH